MKKIEEYVRSIPDFPEEGIIFRDITSVLQDADGLHLAIDSMQGLLDGVDFDVVVGAESRGFVFGTPIAYNLHKPFVLVRKKGKLPCETVSRSYDLEYGTAEIEMHKDSIKPGQRVVLVDDLIATGGLRMISSGLSMRKTQPSGSDFDILFSGLPRLITRAPILGMNASGSLKVSGKELLKRAPMSRQSSTCWR